MESKTPKLIQKKQPSDVFRERFVNSLKQWVQLFVDGTLPYSEFIQCVMEDSIQFLTHNNRQIEIVQFIAEDEFESEPEEEEDEDHDIVEVD